MCDDHMPPLNPAVKPESMLRDDFLVNMEEHECQHAKPRLQ